MSDQPTNNQFLTGLFGGIAAVGVIGLIVFGAIFFSQNSGRPVAGEQNQLADVNSPAPAPMLAQVAGVATFYQKPAAEVCRQDGKPVVYLFSTTWCPHCQWISAAFDEAVKPYIESDQIAAYHWEVDINDDILTAEREVVVPPADLAVYRQFNPEGSIPTFVFGCKYYRIGNGYEQENDLTAEQAEFTALIEDLLK